MKTANIATIGLGVFLAWGLTACNPDEGQLATVQVKLIDAPADYDNVFIDIVDVQMNTGEGDEGWESLNDANPGVYDLLELTNGESAFLGEIALPAGELSQVRLILGDENTLVTDGDTIALSTPSAQQSGLKLNINQTLVAGVTYELVIDFDAARSVVKAGNSGTYNLKPVIRASMDPQTGAIVGVTDPDSVSSTVYAIIGTDTLTSTYTDDAGSFMLSALPEGTYTLSVEPESGSGFITTDVTGVSVVVGESNDVGTIVLSVE